MRVTTDLHEFYQATKIILDSGRLRQLGIETDDIAGSFRPHEVADLLDFCANNPGFHVVSYLGDGVYINRYDERGGLFKLAEGDNDQNFLLNGRGQMSFILQDIFERTGFHLRR